MGKQYDISLSFEPLWYKRVRVVDIDGKVYEGEVIDVGRADDNDSGEDSIGIETHPDIRSGYDLDRSEIVSIEIIE